jgi:uncharacterized membrane protein
MPLKDAIAWSHWYRLASYAKSALWMVPFVAIPLEFAVSRLTEGIEGTLGWTLLGLSEPGARSLYETIITMTLSFMVFTFGSLLVAIQVASGQMTPRVIATTLLRDNTVRYTVGLFVFTLLYALRGLDRMGHVQQFNVFTAALLGLASLTAFLYLIDYAARLLRPGSIVWRVGEAGIAVMAIVHPCKHDAPSAEEPARTQALPPPGLARQALVLHQGTSGTVLAVNLPALAAEARLTGGMIELIPQVGDFVSVDEPLFWVYGAPSELTERRLRTAVAVGPERTMEQDPAFAFRILVDIALKALSKAINDPTTAVLAIDQIHRLLRTAGMRHLQHEQIADSTGRVLVVVRTPNWEDYVHLACREIRLHAAEHIQIARRLRAMLENLAQTLPERRRAALRLEIDLLDRSIQNTYLFAEDMALARIPDAQGMGGASTAAPVEQGLRGQVADAA